MREIKFRFWDGKKLRYTFRVVTHGELNFCNFTAEFPDYVWQQYTGLHDKNGKEIYEGDIVQDESIYRAPDWQYQIIWSDLKAGWIAYPVDESNLGFGMSKEASFSLEVIGNIYEK
jgi:uncharacterized phage protein (TIGR01671 family)